MYCLTRNREDGTSRPEVIAAMFTGSSSPSPHARASLRSRPYRHAAGLAEKTQQIRERKNQIVLTTTVLMKTLHLQSDGSTEPVRDYVAKAPGQVPRRSLMEQPFHFPAGGFKHLPNRLRRK